MLLVLSETNDKKRSRSEIVQDIINLFYVQILKLKRFEIVYPLWVKFVQRKWYYPPPPPDDQWAILNFSGDSRFNRSYNDGRARVWKTYSERFVSEFLSQTQKGRGPGAVVKAACLESRSLVSPVYLSLLDGIRHKWANPHKKNNENICH